MILRPCAGIRTKLINALGQPMGYLFFLKMVYQAFYYRVKSAEMHFVPLVINDDVEWSL
jgi:hypothetical protein